VVAEKEGYPLAAATVSVGAGEERAVELRLTASTVPGRETPPPPEQTVTTKPSPPGETIPPAETKVETPAEDSTVLAARGRAKTIAGAAVLGVGVAALAAGIAMGVLAKQAGDDISSAAKNLEPYSSSKYSAGQTDQSLMYALVPIGAAAVVAGAVVLVLGRRQVFRSRVQVTPAVSPDSVGATVRLSF
jgi:hypothetical protein